jgi:aspartate/methionine/tyrosine aminotransferase
VLAELRPATRLVVITNPHNPSGVLTDDATITELARQLERRRVLLFVDEAYLELARPRTSARRLGDNVLTCSSATKCWGVPWARAGWALVPARFAADVLHVERYVAGLAPPAAWAWGERVLERADALLERAERMQAGKRELVDAFLARASDALEWTPPHPGSLYGFVRDRRGICSLARIERGVTEQGVLVSPGEFFGEPGSFRLSWTAEPQIVVAGLERLAAVLELVTLRSPP